jgi:hypothetical protein
LEGFDHFCKQVRHHLIEMEGDLCEPGDLLQSVLFKLFTFFDESSLTMKFTHQHELMIDNMRFIIEQHLAKKKLGRDEHRKQFEEAEFEEAFREHKKHVDDLNAFLDNQCKPLN